MENGRGDDGFTLIEVTAGVAIVSLAVAGLFLTAISAVKAESQARSIEAITGSAEDTATDLRALGAYDPAVLAPLADGRPRTLNGTAVTLTAAGANAYDVVVSAGSGSRTISVKSRIVQEAPPPGAQLAPQPPLKIWQASPPPTAPRHPDPTPAPCRYRPPPRERSIVPPGGGGPGVLPPCDGGNG